MINCIVKDLGQMIDYQKTYQAMIDFTNTRTLETPDEFWVLSHAPVYTIGLAGLESHLLQATNIPVVKINRGGQITYHGPGQIIIYTLINLKRLNIYIKALVNKLEQALINTLAIYNIEAMRYASRPGVYIYQQGIWQKIAALGLKVTSHYVYHGIALNIDMDLKPFQAINPCGYSDLITTDMQIILNNKTDINLAMSKLLDIEIIKKQLVNQLQLQLYI